MKRLLCYFALLITISAEAQGHFITNAYSANQQICNVSDVTDITYIFELYSDTNITVSIYTMRYNWPDCFKSVQTFSGKASTINGVLHVVYNGQSFRCSNSNPFKNKFVKPTLYLAPIKYPSADFILSGNTVAAKDNLFPIMRKISVDDLGYIKLPYSRL